MYYVYVLMSESTGRLYKGSTEDLPRRLEEHNANLASATKNRGPWKLVYHEECPTRSAAMLRERYFKTGKGREELKEVLAVSSIGRVGRGRTLNQ
ncbi:MAG: GIY-YIG nuclease family protein [Acidobacteriia bacterium]|nr:GIY-YIG nuclease family protein [Terriglobia bacterium]